MAQVFNDGDGSRFVWTTDLIAADEVVAQTDEAMKMGIGTVKKALETAD